MNLNDLHNPEKAVSAISIFKSENSTVTAIQILAGEQLKEHITKTPALLVCLSGQAKFENENGIQTTLNSGDYLSIEPNVKHHVDGISNCQLILIK